MSKLSVGDAAPDFSAPDENNKVHTLSDYKGKKLVLVIYVLDGSKGCSTELSSVQSSFSKISKAGYQVLGVSKNSVDSHLRFHDKLGLSFDLLSDPDMTIIKAYDAYGPKGKKDGVEKYGVIRTIYLIDEKGKISAIIDKVDTKTAGDQITTAITGLS